MSSAEVRSFIFLKENYNYDECMNYITEQKIDILNKIEDDKMYVFVVAKDDEKDDLHLLALDNNVFMMCHIPSELKETYCKIYDENKEKLEQDLEQDLEKMKIDEITPDVLELSL